MLQRFETTYRASRTMFSLGAFFVLLIFQRNMVLADDEENRMVFESRYAEMNKAIVNHDKQAVLNVLSPDFKSIDVHGKQSGITELLQQSRAPLPGEKKDTKTTLITVQNAGDKTYITQQYDAHITRKISNGSMNDIAINAVSKDTWTLISDKWLLQSTVTQQMDVMVNNVRIIHEVSGRRIP